VENYVRYRPGYPSQVVELFRRECGLTHDSVVADIASGTGILTRMLLENGNRAFGVEPNPEMRKAGEEYLARFPKFVSVAGTAEATTLGDNSVDLVAAAQAAHWFDRQRARREFVRILRPGGWVALLWNERRVDSSAFLRAYEALLVARSTDYGEVRHERTTSAIAEFFAPAPYQERAFEMVQEFDYPALEGRLLSSSYTPQPGHPNYKPMLNELRRMFDLYQSDRRVRFEYNTRVYYGQLG
jgi:SAM-dependent methyltransferase